MVATRKTELPRSLHDQIFLLAYDRRRTRVDGDEASRQHQELEELAYHGIPPVSGMRQAIDAVHSAMSANASGPWST